MRGFRDALCADPALRHPGPVRSAGRAPPLPRPPGRDSPSRWPLTAAVAVCLELRCLPQRLDPAAPDHRASILGANRGWITGRVVMSRAKDC
jgi:hypothetical protein